MPTRDKKRVYDELFGFRMAVHELNRSLKEHAAKDLPDDFSPHAPKRRSQFVRTGRADNGATTRRFIRAATDAISRRRRKRRL